MKSKRYAVVNRKRCVSCGECQYVCRKNAIKVINGCYAEADTEICVGCGLCSKSCPSGCITIVQREDNSNEEKMV